MQKSALVGTERSLSSQVKVLGRAAPGKTIRVTIHVRRSADPTNAKAREFASKLVSEGPRARSHLSRAEYAAQLGAAPADVQKVRRFARQFGLRLVVDRTARGVSANPLGLRTVEVEGTIASLRKAFGVDFVRIRDENGNIYRTYSGALNVPSEFSDVIGNVFGLDSKPQVRARFRRHGSLGGFDASAAAGFSPDQLAQLYSFPTGVDGTGQTIGIIEFGGGFRRRDLANYFRELGIPMPTVQAVSIGQDQNSPDGNPNGPDGEVMLDIEVAGAVAPGAKLVVYFAPNTSRGFFRAINTAVHDSKNAPAIISISWGGPESTWSLQDMNSITDVCEAAATMGVSIFCAAGDDGSGDGVADDNAHVDFPASCPFITACGGTTLQTDDSGSSVTGETVWNDGSNGGTGGGVSDVFPVPDYQTGPAISIPASLSTGKPGRGVPDISANADPNTGYKIRVDGVDTLCGGTSAVAPLWAGLFALINQSLGQPVGFANTLLYSAISAKPGALRDVTVGDNDTTGKVGGYSAGPGWDPCTGLGTPANGQLILQALQAL